MNILHISDCHGDIDIFEKYCLNNSDIIISTGDFFSNILHDGTNSGLKDDDIREQLKYIGNNRDRIIQCLRNRPLIYVQGNHDWINFSSLNYDKLYELNNSEIVYKIGEKKYKLYGFPNTPNIIQWNHYTSDFENILGNIPIDTDILVTHAPPRYILDYSPILTKIHEGIIGLVDKIKQTKIRLHLFGHVHHSDDIMTIDNIIFSNASKYCKIIDFN